MSVEAIYNYLKVDDTLSLAGQPTAEQLREAAAAGFAVVINLATDNPRYSLPDEAGLVRSLGLTYFHIPVAWENPQLADFAAFERVMAERPAGRLLLHCAANYRATAFYGLYAQKHFGWSAAQMDEFRAEFWDDGESYPAWDAFIAAVRAQITAAG